MTVSEELRVAEAIALGRCQQRAAAIQALYGADPRELERRLQALATECREQLARIRDRGSPWWRRMLSRVSH